MLPDIQPFFAHIGDDPLTCAFEEEKKDLPPLNGARMNKAEPSWDGGKFEDFAARAYIEGTGRPLALYVHVPFCHHHCKFCPFYKNRTSKTFSPEYAALLSREIADTAHVLREVIHRRSVRAIYFGGGTPSDLDTQDMVRLIRQLRDTFPVDADAEMTVEGRVRGFTADKGKAWAEAGANRFSLGVQTTDTKLRRSLGRISARDEIRENLNGLCESGAAVVADLIYGFPGQTKEMLAEDIRFLSEETGIHGLDLYKLGVFPDSPLDKAIRAGKLPPLPNFPELARMFGTAYEALLAYGYEHFSPKHWRRSPLERSVYNRLAFGQTDMLPFGSGAGGRLGAISLGNIGELKNYTEKVSRGEKPLARIAPVPLRDAQEGFETALSAAMEALKLPKLDEWPRSHRQQGEKLLDQWRRAGLLVEEKDGEEMRMTCAGNFWSPRLKKMLLDFAATPAAG
ncbi:MAG: heme anaerobic degradation radical SAM methyltransferase ChuW/HutW [Azoarcus sp.]|jgi:oxygen-independent coproporphyrinogen-3 oxidase|nr:heme anaerobic degradation radical SAM methyltransferase ChuW/HutW [Azoarcus sp.]